MLITKRKPVPPGEILLEEFMQPLGITQTELAERTGPPPQANVNELCRGRRAITADTALILSRVFGTSPEFWLNTQRRTDIWEALHTSKRLLPHSTRQTHSPARFKSRGRLRLNLRT